MRRLVFYLKVSDALSDRDGQPYGFYDAFVANQLSGIDVEFGEEHLYGIVNMLLNVLKIQKDYL